MQIQACARCRQPFPVAEPREGWLCPVSAPPVTKSNSTPVVASVTKRVPESLAIEIAGASARAQKTYFNLALRSFVVGGVGTVLAPTGLNLVCAVLAPVLPAAIAFGLSRAQRRIEVDDDGIRVRPRGPLPWFSRRFRTGEVDGLERASDAVHVRLRDGRRRLLAEGVKASELAELAPVVAALRLRAPPNFRSEAVQDGIRFVPVRGKTWSLQIDPDAVTFVRGRARTRVESDSVTGCEPIESNGWRVRVQRRHDAPANLGPLPDRDTATAISEELKRRYRLH